MSEQNGLPPPAPRGLARDVGEFARDVLTLAELQARMFATDWRAFSRRALVPGLVLLAGVALGLSCIPFALAALALLFVEVLETSHATGFLLATIVGAVSSALLGVSGWLLVRKRLAFLQRSQRELVRNLRWIKTVLERERTTRSDRTDNSGRTAR